MSHRRWLPLLAASLFALPAHAKPPADTLLNVSYDASRELYSDINRAFIASQPHGTDLLNMQMSHGGSGRQARAVLEGLPADVVTLALAPDIDALAKAGLVAHDWPSRFPEHAAPFTSTVVFLVRPGNPKEIHDWPDLIRPGIQVITPNPKTSGGARWNFLAAWGWALKQPNGNEARARAYVQALYQHVSVLDTGARAATNTFALREVGDVLVTWESEALLLEERLGITRVQIVRPSRSILAETPVALVEPMVDRHDSRTLAQAYLHFLYTPRAQEIAAQHYFRPRSPELLAKYLGRFLPLATFTIDDTFGDWPAAQAKFFDDGGLFDQITPGMH